MITIHDLICPHCGKAFKIDETSYADILKQVRDSDFDKQLHDRLALAEQEKRTAVKLAETEVDAVLQRVAADNGSEIRALKVKLDGAEVDRQLAVTQALNAMERQRDAFAPELEQAKRSRPVAAEFATSTLRI